MAGYTAERRQYLEGIIREHSDEMIESKLHSSRDMVQFHEEQLAKQKEFIEILLHEQGRRAA